MKLKSLILPIILALMNISSVAALPPPEDVAEEVLRTQIITEGRSPLDGKPLTAAEYAELQAELAETPFAPELNPKIQELVFLLQLLKFVRVITPF